MDLPATERYTEVVAALKPQITKMFNEYLHLCPRIIREVFADHQRFIKMRHHEYYEEVQGYAEALGFDPNLLLMLNYAFELDKALCTSIVARMPDGKVIHGRNLDFGFADAVRNATFRGEFYRRGKLLFEAIQFGGDVGVYTGSRPGKYYFSLNARNSAETKGVDAFFKVLAHVMEGLPEIAFLARDALTTCEDYDCVVDAFSHTNSIVPIYLIIAGNEANQGMVLSKDSHGVANIRTLDEDNWYLVQTNDDHFSGTCLQRCQDANANMQAVGEANISQDTLLYDVMLQSHTINIHTIYTTIANPTDNQLSVYGYNSDNEYVK